MPDFHVEFTRTVRYSATVEAETATDAGIMVGDVIRADEGPRGRKYTIEGDPEVQVVDEGLGEMSARRTWRTWPVLEGP